MKAQKVSKKMTYLCHISEMTRTNVTFWVVRVIIRVEKSAVWADGNVIFAKIWGPFYTNRYYEQLGPNISAAIPSNFPAYPYFLHSSDVKTISRDFKGLKNNFE